MGLDICLKNNLSVVVSVNNKLKMVADDVTSTRLLLLVLSTLTDEFLAGDEK